MQISSERRLFAIDLLKALSIVAAVSYHAIVVPESTYESEMVLLNALFTPLRFCVPTFLVISFFLLQTSCEKKPQTSTIVLFKKRFYRLLIPTIFWCTLTAILRILSKTNSISDIAIPLIQGTVFPGAYYLLALLQLTPIFFLTRRRFEKLPAIVIAILAQMLIVLLVYALLYGILGTNIISLLRSINRPLIIYWLVYIPLGIFLYTHWDKLTKLSHQISMPNKVALITLSFLTMTLEFLLVHVILGIEYQYFEYVKLTCIAIVPILFLCCASVDEKRLPQLLQRLIKLFSKYSLGIFCINGVVSSIFLEISSKFMSISEVTFSFPEILVIKLIGWGLLFAISLCLSVLLKRLGLGNCVC
jgi:Acyltransferase family